MTPPTTVNRLLSVTGVAEMPLVEEPLAPPAPGEVTVAVAYCGICGSDFPRYFDGGVHSFPQVLGHEFSGVVVALGEGVAGVALGTRVAVAPLSPCHGCEACAAGHYSLCPRYTFIGSRRQGALATYVNAPAANLVPLPDGMRLRDAALVEPLTVAIHGLERADYTGVDRAAVFGAGVIGLLAIQTLKARGVRHVTAIDVQPDKLDLARRLGADEAVPGSDLAARLADRSAAPGVCLETAGHPVTQVQAVQTVARGGQVVYIGTCTRPVAFEAEQFELILRGELGVTGSWMSYSAPFPGHEWTQAVELLASGAIDADAVVSREFPLDSGAAAFDAVRGGRGALLKVLYAVGGENAGAADLDGIR
ncbi:galactitol-1-phosphate 5-dehydrogenase [Actinomyces israelii]|uniref:galactitol-1-phosphate 5-dehydrogenase n=1 Tax=Actinomyces israelii TaxID=1659 RepID=UPI0006943C6D|nr:galactitol-1-phosphate 5-dehydrogenase [Actinomyces israelii]